MLYRRYGEDFNFGAYGMSKTADLQRVLLPISYDETKDAVRANLNTWKSAFEYLANGSEIGADPLSAASTTAMPFTQSIDPD